MYDTGLFDAELDSAALGRLDGAGNIHGHRTDLRVRHHATRAEYLAETADERHHVRGRDATIEVDLAALNDFNQFFCTNNVSAGSRGFISLGATCEDGDANVTARAVRQVDNATNHLVRVARVNAEVHRNFNGFIELGDSTFLDHRNGVGENVKLVGIHTFADLLNALCYLGHDQPTTSRPMARAEPSTIAIAPSMSAAFRSFILASAIVLT
ncbi:hypothetical protein D3C71_944580 [compost metagenome]